MVVFDPPHLLRNVGKSKMADMYGSLNEKAQPTGYQHIKYGALYSDWRDMGYTQQKPKERNLFSPTT